MRVQTALLRIRSPKGSASRFPGKFAAVKLKRPNVLPCPLLQSWLVETRIMHIAARSTLIAMTLLLALPTWAAADPGDARFPLGPQLRVLAEDVESPAYRRLIDEMLLTDLNAEWTRVESDDNAARFLDQHGGREAVLADPELKRAYERRVEIREKFLELMRVGYRRYKKPAPFDQGATAEQAATISRQAAGAAVKLEVVLPAQGAERQWPRFRGPSGQGNSSAKKLPLTWNRAENVVWHTELPGTGNSSPVIWGERIFLTSAGEEGADRSLHCIRATDGTLLWTRAHAAAQGRTQCPRKERVRLGYARHRWPARDRFLRHWRPGGLRLRRPATLAARPARVQHDLGNRLQPAVV